MKAQNVINRNTLLAVAALVLTIAGPAYAGPGSQGNPRILPPNSHAFGKTYGEWSAAHWEWLYCQQVSQNPLFMDGDVDLSLGQPDGPVWFLGGTFSVTPVPAGGVLGLANRTGVVPAGKALFFPLIDTEWDNSGIPPTTFTTEELRSFAKAGIDVAYGIACEIDGQSVLNVSDPISTAYRVVSPVFSYTLPATDNIVQSFGIDISGTITGAVADGICLLLAPLPVGQHTIHFTAAVPGFVEDITYNLTVE